MLGVPTAVVVPDTTGNISVSLLNGAATGGGGGGGGGAAAWGFITGTLSAQTDLQAALNAKAAVSHTHAIGDTTGLQAALDAKAAASHTHAIGDTTGLQAALDAKAAATHTHAIGDTTGLQAALDGKAAAATVSAIVATVNAQGDAIDLLDTELDGKAAVGHTHAIADTTGLQAALDAKAAVSHTHAISDTTGLQAALDAKAAASHTHGNITNAGAIGSTANLPVITGSSGVLVAGSFGSAANTFCQGNDSRLSDARAPTAHTHGLTESYVGEIEAAKNQDYTIDLRVPLGREVTEFSIIADSGACTAALKNGANTIVGSVSVSTTIATRTGGDLDGTHKNLAANAKLVLTLSSNSAALRVQFCVKYAAVTGAIS